MYGNTAVIDKPKPTAVSEKAKLINSQLSRTLFTTLRTFPIVTLFSRSFVLPLTLAVFLVVHFFVAAHVDIHLC